MSVAPSFLGPTLASGSSGFSHSSLLIFLGRLRSNFRTAALSCGLIPFSAATDTIFNALEAGASGYLLKRSDPAKVLEALTELYHGGAPMTGEIARNEIDSFHRAKATASPQDKLTAHAEEILEHLAKGFVTKEIADKLAITPATVRFHLRHICDKLHVHSRVEAVIKYLG